MKLLKTITEEDVFGVPYDGEEVELETLYSARLVLLNDDGEVAIINVVKKNYRLLPGGGAEPGEDALTTARRECLEETGYEPEIMAEIGRVKECRPEQERLQVTDCYLARVAGGDGVPQWTEDELEKLCEVEWYPVDEAINVIDTSRPKQYPSKFSRVRDVLFLREAQKKL